MVPPRNTDFIDCHYEHAVLYHSSNFLVVNKMYDMLINSNDPTVKNSMEQLLNRKFPSLRNSKLKHGFYFVHRLDYPTSGVMCVALNKKAASAATFAFEKRKTRKYYLAILRGHVAREILDIEAPIGELASEKNGNHRMCVEEEFGDNCMSPRNAHTRLLVLEKGVYDSYPATKVLLRPITGRRHQLRVHCAFLGHTIVGDFTYSRRKDVTPYRTFLHSFRLVVPNEVESLDVRTSDPFVHDMKNHWVPVEKLNSLECEGIFAKLDLENESISGGSVNEIT